VSTGITVPPFIPAGQAGSPTPTPNPTPPVIIDPIIVLIPKDGVVKVKEPTYTEYAYGGARGTLVLEDAPTFHGTVAGLHGHDRLDLSDITFGADTTLAYTSDGHGVGTLTVSDGTNTANITLFGHYMASSFAMAADHRGGTVITEVPHEHPWVSPPRS
jgi:hypothetical protein